MAECVTESIDMALLSESKRIVRVVISTATTVVYIIWVSKTTSTLTLYRACAHKILSYI